MTETLAGHAQDGGERLLAARALKTGKREKIKKPKAYSSFKGIKERKNKMNYS